MCIVIVFHWFLYGSATLTKMQRKRKKKKERKRKTTTTTTRMPRMSFGRPFCQRKKKRVELSRVDQVSRVWSLWYKSQRRPRVELGTLRFAILCSTNWAITALKTHCRITKSCFIYCCPQFWPEISKKVPSHCIRLYSTAARFFA